jgi:hypothetical protein
MTGSATRTSDENNDTRTDGKCNQGVTGNDNNNNEDKQNHSRSLPCIFAREVF